MKVSAQKLRQRSTLLALAFFLPFNFLAHFANGFNGTGIPCIWKAITGYPCPGCGLTRGFAAVARGDLMTSIHLNPLALISVLLLLFTIAKPEIAYEKYQRLTDAFNEKTRTQQTLVVIFAMLVLYALNIVRVQTGFYPR